MEERISKALEIATDTKVFEMGPGASAVAPEVFGNLFPGRKAVVIADVNTWPVLGEKVFKLFRSAGIPVSEYRQEGIPCRVEICRDAGCHSGWRHSEGQNHRE
mgnify:CR=1 FL=1